jgi:hypothetical protein
MKFGKSTLMIMTATAALGMGHAGPLSVFSDSKSPKKCLLPSCKNLTDHNGGYCSAKHSAEHRQLLKGK